ncbi:MAG: hypothetical protein EAY81_02100 [Bacteroidetes bacterium]|nr:MAG: hypothetical protein EAY81_02100 [Bacteroidota bacterium]
MTTKVVVIGVFIVYAACVCIKLVIYGYHEKKIRWELSLAANRFLSLKRSNSVGKDTNVDNSVGGST